MTNPRQADCGKLVGIAKYLKSNPTCVISFRPHKDVYRMNGFGDNDFPGEVETGKSPSGVMTCLGYHMRESWSSIQTVTALSTAEAELYELDKVAAACLGL